MPQLTEWLKLMVAEINRKREDEEAARKEDVARATPQKDLPSAEPRRSN